MKPKLFNGVEWIEFETAEAHDAYVKSITQEQPKVRTVEQDMEYGKQVILEYLRENKLLEALRVILISMVEVDEILTQERKDKYIQMLTDFLK